MMAQTSLRWETDPLSPESAREAEEELRETPERTQQALAELRQLLSSNNTLRYPDKDEFLVRFLRPTKFYPESAYKLMVEAVQFRRKYAEVVGNLMPSDEEKTFCENDIVNILADRDQHGRRILVLNMGENWDPSKVTALQIFRCVYLIHVGACLEPETQVKGIVVVVNLRGFGARQLMSVCPSQAKMRLTFYQKAMPLRLKQIHVVNEPAIFSAVLAILRPFMQEKLRSRFFCHGKDTSSLLQHIDASCLPEELGGSLPMTDYSGKDWYPMIKKMDAAMAEWNAFGLATDAKEDD